MRGLRNRFERFCYRNRNKGIPNLMLYIVLGCAVVSVLELLGYPTIYNLLRFDRQLILQGQLWRLVTYAFTMSGSNLFFTLIILYCYYSIGRSLELSWGTLRFNLYYFSGILLMDIFALALGGFVVTSANGALVTFPADLSNLYSGSMTEYLHLSMLICFATSFPDTRFYIFYFIPVKAWILALIYLTVTLFNVVRLTVPVLWFPINLFPLVALANYFLFYGKDVANVLPPSWRRSAHRAPKKQATAGKRYTPVYTHRCAICGRTDGTNPELEFRYCSRCNGYFCYCQEHINNHTHIE